MRTFYDPLTIAVAAFSVIGGIQQSNIAKAEASSEAGFLEMEAFQEQKQNQRELRDLERERSRTQARSLAVLAAQGSAGFGTGLAIQKTQAAKFAIERERLIDDSVSRQTGLRVRAQNTRSLGKARSRSALIGGAARAGQTFLR